MNFRKKYTITFLFLFYFLLYVVSPLCYAEDRISEDSIITHAAKYNTPLIPPLSRGELKGGVRVIWELILSKFSQKEDAEDGSPDVRFFIRKARAVLSSNNTIKVAQSESGAPPLNDHFQRIESVTFSAEFTDVDPQRGFYSSFSGLSPPRV
jgi:hypothetical protein